MTNTTKAWLLCHPIEGYLFVTTIACIGAFFFNNQHWADIILEMETSNFMFYFFIILSPLSIAYVYTSVGGLVFMSIGILCVKAMTAFCYLSDSSSPTLSMICISIDLIAALCFLFGGIRIGKWTYTHMDEVIPRREKWRNSKVDIYSLSLKYSINRGIACWFCANNSIAILLLLIILR